MRFDAAQSKRSCTRRSTSASRCSTPPTSTAAAAVREVSRQGARRARARTSCSRPSSAGRWARRTLERGASRRYVHRGGRGQPAAARHRLHRSLPAALPRPDDADRRDARGARRLVQRRQGSLHRLLELRGLADGRREPTSPSAPGSPRFVTAQNHYNLLERDDSHELLPACDAARIGVLPYFPLASGLLTGKYKRGEKPRRTRAWACGAIARKGCSTTASFDKVERFEGFARERSKRAARPGVRLAAVAAADLERDRRRDAPRASREQREGRRVAPGRRGSTRTRAVAVEMMLGNTCANTSAAGLPASRLGARNIARAALFLTTSSATSTPLRLAKPMAAWVGDCRSHRRPPSRRDL